MDHTLLDVHLVMELDEVRYLGRPWLTILIDVHSRCIVGWVLSFEPPSLYSVTECIKRANRPKLQMLEQYPNCRELAGIYGKFDEIVVDNGLEFVGISFESGMTDVGTSVRWAPSASPTYKAVVERSFRTLNELLNKRLPGGSFPVEQMRAWGLTPQKDAVLTLEQLEDLLEGAIGLYHQDLHTFLGEPPIKAWSRGVRLQGGVPVIGDDSQLDKMVGAEVERRLSTSGILLFGLSYHDAAVTGQLLEDLAGLEAMRPRRKGSATATVKVKFNPANIGSIHVWNAKRGVFQTLPCTKPEEAEGITAWQRKRVLDWERKEQDKTAEERRLLRQDWSERIRTVFSAQAKKRINRNQARLLTSPKIQALGGDHLQLRYAEARHDGMAPVIPQVALASERTDDHQRSSRPQRGGVRKPRPKSPSPTSAASTPPLEEWTIDDGDWGVSQ
jgi:putative transposase